MDTPLVNGTAYPYAEVPAGPVRFRVLNASNDRALNLQIYKAFDQTLFHFRHRRCGPLDRDHRLPESGTCTRSRWSR